MVITNETGNLIINAFACAFNDLIKNNENTESNLEEATQYAKDSFIRFCHACNITGMEVDENENEAEKE